MMEQIQWIFDGVGTQIVCNFLSMIVGGIFGYKIRDMKVGKQSQKARDGANQRQELYLESQIDCSQCTSADSRKSRQVIVQSQKAGDKSTQVQVGGNIHGNHRR